MLFALMQTKVLAQENNETPPDLIFNRVLSGGFIAHTRGLGFGFELGKFRGVERVNTWGLEIVSMKHAKEVHSVNPFYDNARSYIFGKTHSMFAIRPNFGFVKIITPKIRQGGVQLAWSFNIGASLAVTKPVYLEIGGPGVPYEYIEVSKYDPQIHNFENIYGKASGLLGFDELKMQPGGFCSLSMQFEYANSHDRIKGLEVGMALDGFLNRVEIMAPDYVDANNRLYLNLFLQVYFGSKKYIR